MHVSSDPTAEGQWIGEPLTPLAIAAVLLLGTVGMEITGVQPVLFGALVAEHRLSASGLGLATTAEFLTLAISLGLAGAFLKPRGLRMIAAVAALVVFAADLLVFGQTGRMIIINRAVAGAAEGMLVWIPTCMIARSATPALWAGVFLLLQVTAQFVFAAVLPLTLMARFGANAGFAVLAGAAVLALLAAPFTPKAMADLPDTETGARGSSLPPLRGLVSLAAVFLIAAFAIGLFAYLAPMATQFGLPPTTLGFAVSAALACQMGGAVAASLLAKRLAPYPAFLISLIAYVAVIAILAARPDASMFIFAGGLYGFFQVFFMPFQVPMVIEADPTRRAAVIMPGIQLLGAAAGPFFVSFFVTDTDAMGALWVSGLCLVAAFGLSTLLHFRRRPVVAGPGQAASTARS